MLPDQQLSLAAGRHRNYLAEIKKRDLEKYKLMKKMGVRGFEDSFDDFKNQLGDIYYEIQDMEDMSIQEFHKLYGKDIINTVQGFYKCLGQYPFENTGWRTLHAYYRNQEIIERYKQYKEYKDEVK